MARSILNYNGNKKPADSDYDDGDLLDGATGTIIDSKSNSDIHQFFMKVMRLAGITPNGLPDNNYNGHQLVEAVQILSRGGFKSNLIITDSAQTTVIDTSLLQCVIYDEDADPGHIASLDPTLDSRGGFISVRIINESPDYITVVDINGGNVGPGTSYAMRAGTRTFYRVGSNWIVG